MKGGRWLFVATTGSRLRRRKHHQLFTTNDRISVEIHERSGLAINALGAARQRLVYRRTIRMLNVCEVEC